MSRGDDNYNKNCDDFDSDVDCDDNCDDSDDRNDESCMGGLPGIFTRVSKDDDNVDDDNCDDNCDDNDKVVSKLFVKYPGFSLYRLDLSGHGTGDYGQVN